MAKIKVDGLVEEMETEFKQALLSTLRRHFDKDTYSENEVVKTFMAQLKEKCNSWEEVPNKFIRSR